ncbi:MAG: SWIM zinc finger family protein, partial [Desulfomonilaceae bacterium]
MSKKESGFAQLTWDDLTTWAGSTSLSRGKSYKNQVQDLNMTEDGGIIAWVQGSELYATNVMIDSSGKLSASCSCPSNWNPCKHSVALVLSFLDALKGKQDIPEASVNDRRFRLIKEKKNGRTSDWYQDDEDEEDVDLESAGTSQESAEQDDSDLPDPPRRSGKAHRAAVVRRKIESMSKDQLVEFVINLIDEHPEIGARIEEEEDVRSGRISKTVRSIRSEIENLASEPAWENHWSGESNIPDYSHVRSRLESLLNSDHADEVLDLGQDLWSLGNEQLESSDDEGETGEQIAECMKVVFRALDKSTLA